MKNFSLKHSQLTTAIVLSSALLMTACGGGDGHKATDQNSSDSTPTNPTNPTDTQAQGQFIDSGVDNVDVYQNGKNVGKTSKGGYFNYTKGVEVTFKIGKLTLGSTMPKAIITPADLASNATDVVEILQVLQGLNEYNTVENGIYIAQSAVDKANQLDKEMDLSSDKVTVADIKRQIPQLKEVSKDKAVEHFAKAQETLKTSEELSKVADEFLGYWQQSCEYGSQEVFELVKSSTDSNILLGVNPVLSRKFENEDCTGNYKDSQNSNMELKIQIVGSRKEGNETIVKSIREEMKNGKTTTYLDTLTWTGDKIIGDELTFTRQDNLSFDDTPVKPTKVDKLVGYWKGDCYDEGDNKEQSRRIYLHTTKDSNGNLVAKKVILVSFPESNKCNGTENLSAMTSAVQDINRNQKEWVEKAVFDGDNRYSIYHGQDENGNDETDAFTRIPASEFPSL